MITERQSKLEEDGLDIGEIWSTDRNSGGPSYC